MHFSLRSLDPVYFILVHSRALFTHTHIAMCLSTSSGHSCISSRFHLVSFGWLLFIYWTENEIFLNCSHLCCCCCRRRRFFRRWLSDGSMCTGCDNVQVSEHWNTFQNEAHILSWTVGNQVTVAHDTENLFREPWRGGGGSVFCECVSARKKCSVFRRQFEALWSAPIETFGSIYIMNLSVESPPPPSEVASIHSKCNKRMRLRFWWAFQICSDCSHRNCPYFISDRVAEVDSV